MKYILISIVSLFCFNSIVVAKNSSINQAKRYVINKYIKASGFKSLHRREVRSLSKSKRYKKQIAMINKTKFKKATSWKTFKNELLELYASMYTIQDIKKLTKYITTKRGVAFLKTRAVRKTQIKIIRKITGKNLANYLRIKIASNRLKLGRNL